MTILRRMLGVERRSDNQNPLAARQSGGFAGVAVSEQAALAVSTVFACVRLLSEDISMLPVDAIRDMAGRRAPVEPSPSLLERPHPDMTRQEWLGRLLTSLFLRGNAYGRVLAVDRLGYPTAVLPIHPDHMSLRRDKQTGVLWYLPKGFDPTRAFPAGDVVHVKGLILAGADEGLSPVTYARRTLGLAIASEEYGASLFASGGNPSSILKVPQTLTKSQAEEMKDDWELAHSGPSRRPAVLSGGVDWAPVSLSPEDSQFLGTREWEATELCQWFGIDPPIVGILSKQSSWASSVEALHIKYVTHAVMPWVVRLETALAGLLPRGQFVKFNLAALLRADLATRYAAHATAIQWGFESPNEARELEDMERVPGLDRYLTPLNMGALGENQTPGPVAAIEPAQSEALSGFAAELARLGKQLDGLRAELGRQRQPAKPAGALEIERDEYGRARRMRVVSNGSR